MHLALRSTVAIAATPQAVWDALLDVQSWKSSVVSVERLCGKPGTVGEVLRVGQARGADTVFVRMETLAQIPLQWRAQTLVTETPGLLSGYLVYSLHRDARATILIGELLCHSPPPPVPEGRTLEEVCSMISQATQAKFDADHEVLKGLLESR